MRLEVTKRNVEVFLFRIEQGTGYVNGSPLNSIDPLGLDDCQPDGACADHAQQTQMPWLNFAAGAYDSSLIGVGTFTFQFPGEGTTVSTGGASDFCENCKADFYTEGIASNPAAGPPDQLSLYGQSFVNAMGARSGALNKVVNGLAIKTTVLVAAPIAVDAAASATTMQVAVGEGALDSSPVHFAYGVEGQWLHAFGDELGSMQVTSRFASGFAADAQTFSVPILYPEAVLATEGSCAWSCVTATISAVAKGWGWPW